jgi:hypothetical protein
MRGRECWRGEESIWRGRGGFGAEWRDCEALNLAKPHKQIRVMERKIVSRYFIEVVGNKVFTICFIFYRYKIS